MSAPVGRTNSGSGGQQPVQDHRAAAGRQQPPGPVFERSGGPEFLLRALAQNPESAAVRATFLPRLGSGGTNPLHQPPQPGGRPAKPSSHAAANRAAVGPHVVRAFLRGRTPAVGATVSRASIWFYRCPITHSLSVRTDASPQQPASKVRVIYSHANGRLWSNTVLRLGTGCKKRLRQKRLRQRTPQAIRRLCASHCRLSSCPIALHSVECPAKAIPHA